MPSECLFSKWLRPTIAFLLCGMSCGQPLVSQSLAAASAPDSANSDKVRIQTGAPAKSEISEAQQPILHLLNRFTFGPTQRDLAYFASFPVSGNASPKPSGLRQTARETNREIDRWFEQQLHPEHIPDPDLEARLKEFPALQLTASDLLARFPSNAEIRQAANGKLPLPNDPYLAAIYLRHIHLYDDKQAKKQSTQAEQQKDTTQSMMANAAPVAVARNTSLTGSAMKTSSARLPYPDVLVKSVLALPPEQRLDRVVDMLPAEYDEFHANMKGPQRAKLDDGLNAVEREYLHDYDNPTKAVVEEMQEQRLLRDIYSSRQLQEVMTTFWLNHFNVYLHKNDEEPYYIVSYERDVIRPHALGNFEEMLTAVSQSPAMLLYLDNSSSTGPESAAAEKQKERAAKGKPAKATLPGLNENYARELMELHTLGVNGGYTQKDVTEVAKIFTGWTVDKPQFGGGFKFDESRHEPGTKLVLGHKIRDNGQQEGLQLLHILATSPATAQFISRELAISFVSDNPPAALVKRMAQTFLDKHGDIPSILRTMLHSPEFWNSDSYLAKIKTPLEYVASAVRVSDGQVDNPQPLVNALNQLGMPLYACVPPTGYSAKSNEWISTGALVTRMNFGISLATNHYPGIHITWNTVSGSTFDPNATSPISLEEAERALESRLIPSGMSEQTRSAALSQSLEPQATTASSSFKKDINARSVLMERQNAQLAGLLLGSPEFQRR